MREISTVEVGWRWLHRESYRLTACATHTLLLIELLHQVSGDDHALDLARAFADREEL